MSKLHHILVGLMRRAAARRLPKLDSPLLTSLIKYLADKKDVSIIGAISSEFSGPIKSPDDWNMLKHVCWCRR